MNNAAIIVIYFLCGFIVEPAIHSHNRCAKKMKKMALC